MGQCWPLLFLICSGCAAAANTDTMAAGKADPDCFVLPGSRSGVTKSFRVENSGWLEEAGNVDGGAMHMRAAFHPDGRTLYLTSVGIVGWGRWFRDGTRVERGTWEEGIHVRAYAYDPADCSIGALLGAGRMGDETPENHQVYGLEVHPNGRYLYQTTNSLQRIRLFDLPDDRVPVPRAAFDVTAGGEHVCTRVRRLAMHPSARYLYANCNNRGGVEDALQLWAIEDDGSITLLDHYTFPPTYAGVYDPVVHPSGDWLYQPVGSTSREPAESIGAILVYRVAQDGRLALRDQVAVRAIATAESPPDTGYIGGGPITMVLHPDGGTAYVAVNAVIPEREVFPHGFAIYGVEDGGARLVERAWLPALRETRRSDHHGATLAAYGGDLYLYSFLTDYDTIQGGVLQRLRITENYSLEPLDPPWLPTGLFDGRQPIAMPGNGRAPEARPERTGTLLIQPDAMVSPSL
jgi:hypothetical protein